MKILLRSSLANVKVQDPISTPLMHQFLGARYGSDANFKHTSIQVAPDKTGKLVPVLNQHLAAGTFGMPGGGGNGTGLALTGTRLPEAFYEATIEYDVRFVGTSPWPFGGKLPGLGGIMPDHGNPPTGGKPSKYGWSSRPMFRRVHGNPDVANLVDYLYHPDQTMNIGDDFKTDKFLHWENWHTIKQSVRMNSIYEEGERVKADGRLRMWLDGEMCIDQNDIIFRHWYAAKVTHMVFDIFCGGNDPAWAPLSDIDVQIKNLTITTPNR